MNGTATVFIIDDDPASRDWLAAHLAQAGLDVACHDGSEAFFGACHGESSGCVVADFGRCGIDGLRLQAELSRRGLPLPVIFLADHGDIPTSVRAIKAGAFDFMSKPVVASEFVASVQAALAESERLSRRIDRQHAASAVLAGLTRREHEVLLLAVEGLANKLIARQLGISHRTVEVHKARIMHKTGAENLLDLARLVGACSTP